MDNKYKPNSFQKECIKRINQLLKELSLPPIEFSYRKNDHEYLYSVILIGANRYELYIYDNEAELTFLKVEEDYIICESEDYKSESDLIEDFCNKLRKTIQTGKPY